MFTDMPKEIIAITNSEISRHDMQWIGAR